LLFLLIIIYDYKRRKLRLQIASWLEENEEKKMNLFINNLQRFGRVILKKKKNSLV
jgi:hypothetical protein